MKKVLSQPAILIISITAAVTTLLLYRQGAGLSTDSIAYFRFAASHALSDLPVHHGILYALFIGAITWIGVEVLFAAAAVNVIAASVAAITLYKMVDLVFSPASLVMTIGTTLLIMFSLAWLDSFAFAMSEPVFYATLLTSSFFLLKAIDHPAQTRYLWLSAGCAALTALTRYAGICFIALFAGTIWYAQSFRWKGFTRALTYGATASAPLLLIMLWNRSHHGSTTNRQLLLTGIPLQNLAEGSMNIASWGVPFQLILRWPWLHVALATGFLAAVILITLHAGIKHRTHIFFFGITALGYVGFYLIVSATVDLGAFNQRKLSPVFIFGFLTLASWCQDLAKRQQRQSFRILLVILTTYLTAFTAYRSVAYIQDSFRYGREFASVAWEEGTILQAVHILRTQAPIFSNADDAYLLRTGHRIGGIPRRFIRTTTRPAESLPRERERIRRAFIENGAILWKSHLRYWPPYLIPFEDIVEDYELIAFLEEITGTLFTHPSNLERYQETLIPLK